LRLLKTRNSRLLRRATVSGETVVVAVRNQQFFALFNLSLENKDAQAMLTRVLVDSSLKTHVRILSCAVKVVGKARLQVQD